MIRPCLYSDPSQSDPDTKDFWLNMAALTEALQRQAEQNPTASYYNVVLLRYQVGPEPGAGPRRGRGGASSIGADGTIMQIRRGPSPEPWTCTCLADCSSEVLSCPLLETQCTTLNSPVWAGVI